MNIPARIIRRPAFYLGAQILLVFLWQGALGRLRGRMGFDSPDYVDAPLDSLYLALANFRPIGFPLFLKLVGLVSPSYSALPVLLLIVHGAAVWVFWVGLTRVGMSPWHALFAASPLLYADLIRFELIWVHSDVIATSLAVLTVGILFRVVEDGRRLLRWAALSLSLFATYMFRPVFLLLIPLVPLFGMLLLWTRPGGRQAGRTLRRTALGLAAAALVPYLAFSAFRWSIVGRFGITSAVGLNLASITIEYLDEDMLERLPADVRPLAQAILEQRRQHPYAIDAASGSINYDDWAGHIGSNCYNIILPLVVRTYPGDQAFRHYQFDYLRAHDDLHRLGKALILARPGLYLKWIGSEIGKSLGNLARYGRALHVFGLAVFLAFAVRMLRSRSRSAPPAPEGDVWGFQVLVAVGLTFFLVKVLALAMTVRMEPRYPMAASVFLPTVLGSALYLQLRTLTSAPEPDGGPERPPAGGFPPS